MRKVIKQGQLLIDRHDRYDESLLATLLGQENEFRWCRTCKAGLLHDGGDDCPILKCFECGDKSCWTCEVDWVSFFSLSIFRYISLLSTSGHLSMNNTNEINNSTKEILVKNIKQN